ncbi:MAG: MFS transporter [Proteobacteria bacterium]|nr:MFS transporter [Pseudomonadota bacterium]
MPYFSEIYYVPMQRAFGFSNTQIGMLGSTFGLVSLLSYVPGGWLADRYPPRLLLSTALATSGIGGFLFAGFPSFEACLLLHGLWGASTSLIFWSAMIKATRNWGGQREQGRAFGFLEGGRSLSDASFGALLLFLFAWQGADTGALSNTIKLKSSALIVMAVLIWIVMRDPPATQPDTRLTGSEFSWAKVRLVLKMPLLWLLSLVILAANWGMWGTIYFTPYATTIYELGDVWGGALANGKYYLAALAAISAGFIADRIGTAKAVIGLFILTASSFLLFAAVPGAPGLLPLLLINSVVVVTAIYALRGIYFALMEQGNVPIALTGTAVGMVSVIGYTPDTIAPLVSGLVLDAWPGAAGFQILFLLIGIICLLGLFASVIIYRKLQAGNELKICSKSQVTDSADQSK